MKVKLKKISDYRFEEEIEITTLNELKEIYDQFIIIFHPNGEIEVSIYDDYAE